MTFWQRRSTLGLLLLFSLLMASTAAAALAGRHYYSSWSYAPTYTYYYRYYYYKPVPDFDGYKYHYAIYYPAQPRYVYYYNPYASYYWGRYDLEAKGYSVLAEGDRKKNLKEIPESAFPKPGEMPAIPESKDGERIPTIEAGDLPRGEAPKDIPAGAPK
jgi:hypothetical protein